MRSTLQRKKAENLKQNSQKRNIGASVLISTFMCLWATYIFPRWVCLFCWRQYVDRSWKYINRSQTHECGNRGWGRAIPRKGIYKRNCRCSVADCGWDLADCGWGIAEWLKRLAVNANGATTVPSSIPASSGTVESGGPQMNQCWITYIL